MEHRPLGTVVIFNVVIVNGYIMAHRTRCDVRLCLISPTSDHVYCYIISYIIFNFLLFSVILLNINVNFFYTNLYILHIFFLLFYIIKPVFNFFYIIYIPLFSIVKVLIFMSTLIFISYIVYQFNNTHLLYCLCRASTHYTGISTRGKWYYYLSMSPACNWQRRPEVHKN